jgi:hypothetical protein
MINGVLTERTVEEVVPILQTNSDGLKKALEELVKQYKLKQDEMEKWKVCVMLFRSSIRQRRRAHGHAANYYLTEEEQCPGRPTTRAIEGSQFMQQPLTGRVHDMCWKPHEHNRDHERVRTQVDGHDA